MSICAVLPKICILKYMSYFANCIKVREYVNNFVFNFILYTYKDNFQCSLYHPEMKLAY